MPGYLTVTVVVVSPVSLWRMRLVLESPSLSFPFSTYFFPNSNHLSVNISALGNSTFSLFLILIKTYQDVVSPSLSLRLCQITKPSDPLMKDFLLLNILIRDNA